ISPVRDGTGAITNFVAVKRDVTHEVVLEAQLRHAQRMEAVGTLASGVAHDFNNLLTAIFGYTDLAKETLPDGHAAIRSLEMVEHAARQASGVTRSLLTFSRKVTADKAPIQLGTVVTESVRLFRRLLPASIDIANDVPTETDIWVNADAIQVQQVLMNLAANARDAMPDGGRLRISLRQDRANPVNLHTAGGSDGHPTAVLVVEDTGTGMSEETTSRLFEPFYTTKPREQGTGLGMSAVHGIITDHGGRIDVDSQLGKGTRITISLPCCDPSEQLSPEPARARRKPGDGEVILLVEDDPQIRSIMTSTLRAQNHCIIQACGSLEAMAALDTHRNAVRLIVLDADLPKNRGRFCLREMSQMRPDLPVLVVTGSEDIDAQEDLNGKHCVLRKPFAMSGLASLVVNILAKSTVKASRGLQPAREAAP
ncbi:MAG: ATP-binding protein, partial [Phycisphaerae bacterium]